MDLYAIFFKEDDGTRCYLLEDGQKGFASAGPGQDQ